MSIPLKLQAEIVEEDGRKVIKLSPEWDSELCEILRNHDDVNEICAWLKSRATDAFGRDNSDRDE